MSREFDHVFPFEIGSASLKDEDSSRVFGVRFDLKLQVREFEKIDPVLGQAMSVIESDDRFKQIQVGLDIGAMETRIGPTKDDVLKTTGQTVNLGTLGFQKRLIIVKRKNEHDELETVLQLTTTLANTEASAEVCRNYFKGKGCCRLVRVQTEIEEKPKKKGKKGKTADLDQLTFDNPNRPMELIMCGVLIAIRQSLATVGLPDIESLVIHLNDIKGHKSKVAYIKRNIRSTHFAEAVYLEGPKVYVVFGTRHVSLKQKLNAADIERIAWADIPNRMEEYPTVSAIDKELKPCEIETKSKATATS